jgi:hypothetical protein
MVSGGLIRLVISSNEQDLYLTGNPEISFFKTVYKRHTNFSTETYEGIFDSSVEFGKHSKIILPRIGDLISNITLNINLKTLNPQIINKLKNSLNINHTSIDCACYSCLEELLTDELCYGWVNALGHAIIKSTWIEIGGYRIDKQYGEWLEIWSELTQKQEKTAGYNQMIGKVDPGSFTATTFMDDMDLYVPLNFFFCKNYGLALPILALYENPVELYIDLRSFGECWVSNKKTKKSPDRPEIRVSALIDYIYLDLDERQKFYKESHIYLIEQIQYGGNNPILSTYGSMELIFDNPVKELVWVLQRSDVVDEPNGVFENTNYPIGNDWFNFSITPDRKIECSVDPFETAVLQVNGADYFYPKKASYFRLLQPYYHHTRIPTNYIYSYSFSLRPEELQPTGQINMSKIEYSKLSLKLNNKLNVPLNLKTYAVSYNVLLITQGMASVLFL